MNEIITFFAIGASFLWDSQPALYNDVYPQLQGGWHIRAASNLQDIWNDPNTTDAPLTAYGPYTEALPDNTWDNLVLQTYPKHGHLAPEYLQAESAALLNFLAINNNTETKILIYESWPTAAKLNQWYLPNTGGETNVDLRDQETYRAFYDLVATLTTNPVVLVPTGDIFAMMPSGTELYRDAQHASEFMRGVLNETVAAMLAEEYDLAKIHPVALQALFSEPRSGVTPEAIGDFNHDDMVNGLDLTDPTLGWKVRYGNDLDGNNFLTWQQQFSSAVGSVSSPTTTVPEPSALLLGAMASIGLMLRRRSCGDDRGCPCRSNRIATRYRRGCQCAPLLCC